ncbi:MAG: tRNA 2-thiouridine(34) synthase MnmA [Candidatus Moranbacteria bacterium]|nr:tRNA 2-thiouridine(34) synthase MnmA [Candidatus Moranbacteria bacterium]
MKENGNTKNNILVGFSGGADSTAAIYFLKEMGYEPVALHLKLFEEGGGFSIRRRAEKLGVKLIEKDISKDFQTRIVDYFVNEYAGYRTPNPCVKCNAEIKFKYLIETADSMGIEKVSTGHYAKIAKTDRCFQLKKGEDEKKDQSYFLYRLIQDQLSRIVFPLEDKNKEENKKLLKKEGISFEKGESQDACFFSGGESLKDFLGNFSLESNKPGKIVDEKGEVVGEHKGLAIYTRGQRKGLRLGGSGPYYVIGKKTAENVLVVTSKADHPSLSSKKIIISDVNWICAEPEKEKKYQFKSRYQAGLSEGCIRKNKKGFWQASLTQPQFAAAPGQSLVLYDGDRVVGGGIIRESGESL